MPPLAQYQNLIVEKRNKKRRVQVQYSRSIHHTHIQLRIHIIDKTQPKHKEV